MNYINFSNQDEILRAQAREANDKFKRQRESRLNKPNQDEILRAQAREANDKFKRQRESRLRKGRTTNQDEILRAQAREANDKFKRQRIKRRINLAKGPVPTPSLPRPNTFTPSRKSNINLKKAPQPSQPQKGSKINLQRTAQQNLDKSARSQAYRKANKFRPLRKALTGKWARRGAIGVGLAGLGAGATAITMGALNRRKRGRRLQ